VFDIPKLSFNPIPQISWYLQIRDKMMESKRPIDKMSTVELIRIYKEKKFLCDTCGKIFDKCNFTLDDHIIHLINPSILWSCDDCLIKDMKKGKIIASTPEPQTEPWKKDFM
jgi:hypothetical protein